MTLSWQKPKTGGPAADYRIQRRTAETDWKLVTLTYKTEIKLTRQPTGKSLEYRVVASNKVGQSQPSNTVTVVL